MKLSDLMNIIEDGTELLIKIRDRNILTGTMSDFDAFHGHMDDDLYSSFATNVNETCKVISIRAGYTLRDEYSPNVVITIAPIEPRVFPFNEYGVNDTRGYEREKD